MNLEKFVDFDNHELILSHYDKETGLKGFIAIHNINLGPAAGATRYWEYSSEEAAITDALKLSKGMTYKCALAGVPFGGGKSVIIADSKRPKSKKLLEAYARKINLLGGLFYTGQDVGMTKNDVKLMSRYTKFVIGKLDQNNNPPYWTAVGIFSAIKAGLKNVFGRSEISGRTFAIKGVGKVGSELCELIYKNGGNIIVADTSESAVRRVKRNFPNIKVVSVSEIHKQKVDVYSPCALGGEFNCNTIKQLKCKIICGGANNQLSCSTDGDEINKKGILYLPDYVVNAGGLINVVSELNKGGYKKSWVEEKVKGIGEVVDKIIKTALNKNIATNIIADQLAEKIYKKLKK